METADPGLLKLRPEEGQELALKIAEGAQEYLIWYIVLVGCVSS